MGSEEKFTSTQELYYCDGTTGICRHPLQRKYVADHCRMYHGSIGLVTCTWHPEIEIHNLWEFEHHVRVYHTPAPERFTGFDKVPAELPAAIWRNRDLLDGEVDGTINIHGKSRDPRAKLLSALANRPFQMSGQWFASLEGFYQGIKFSFNDPRRHRAFASSFGHAKAFSLQAVNDYVWWDGTTVNYSSTAHKLLIRRAFWESFNQNPDRIDALRATRGLVLVHETGEGESPNSPCTRAEFCKILTEIRESYL